MSAEQLAQAAAEIAATAVREAAARTFAIRCALGMPVTDDDVAAVKEALHGYANDIAASAEVTP